MKRKKKKHIVMAAALLTCTLSYLGLQRSYMAAEDPCKFVQVAADVWERSETVPGVSVVFALLKMSLLCWTILF